MKEKIKQMIAEQIIEQGKLNVTLRNLREIGELTKEMQDELLDAFNEKQAIINKLKEILKQI